MLKDMGVSATDYSTHSFRRGGLSILADREMHPSYIQNSAQHKRWDSSVTYIKPSLSKALWANNLLSGNNPEEGWGSRYSGNPRSLAPFLPKQSIKSLPSSVQVAQYGRPSVILSTNSYTKGLSIVIDSLSENVHTFPTKQSLKRLDLPRISHSCLKLLNLFLLAKIIA